MNNSLNSLAGGEPRSASARLPDEKSGFGGGPIGGGMMNGDGLRGPSPEQKSLRERGSDGAVRGLYTSPQTWCANRRLPQPQSRLLPSTSQQLQSRPSNSINTTNGASNGASTGESPYPWSQRRLTFTVSHTNPFPRYGAAVNATGSKDGAVYLMGGLINGSTVKGDLWMVEAGPNANMSCYPVATTSEGPGPRVGHASLLVGNAFIVFGGDTKMDEGDSLDDTLYLLNTCMFGSLTCSEMTC